MEIGITPWVQEDGARTFVDGRRLEILDQEEGRFVNNTSIGGIFVLASLVHWCFG